MDYTKAYYKILSSNIRNVKSLMSIEDSKIYLKRDNVYRKLLEKSLKNYELPLQQLILER